MDHQRIRARLGTCLGQCAGIPNAAPDTRKPRGRKRSGGSSRRSSRSRRSGASQREEQNTQRAEADEAADALIGEEGEGFRYILSGMNAERILIGAECVGDAKWFIRKASEYAGSREVFDRPIGQNQGVQFPIARCYAQMRAAELMVRHAARAYDSGEGAGKAGGEQANMAKLLASEASWSAADMCVQTHGGFGFAEEYDVERKFREARLYTVAPISTNAILSYIAEHVLGLPRSY